MQKAILVTALLLGTSTAALAQPAGAVDITNAQIQKVLKEQPKAVDHQLRVIDMGSYQLAVGVIHRGPTGRAAGRPPARMPTTPACGVTTMPAGGKEGPGGIAHDDTVETYVVIAGSGTLVTGGEILNGHQSGPDSEVTKILNGPSCSGRIVGDFVSRHMGVGDISVIPAGVPHGWTDVTSGVTYLSIRPDPKKVLEHGYVNPALK